MSNDRIERPEITQRSMQNEMQNEMNLVMKKPCNGCPFRKTSTKSWVKRMDEIVKDTVFNDETFTCHKFEGKNRNKGKQCAGRLILQGRENRYGSFTTRLLAELDNFTYERLGDQDAIFDTAQDCIDHHCK